MERLNKIIKIDENNIQVTVEITAVITQVFEKTLPKNLFLSTKIEFAKGSLLDWRKCSRKMQVELVL
jgi:hypothetical protein